MLRKKLIHISHSGKLRPHEHTSYLFLAIILVFVGVSLLVYTAKAATPYDGPEADSIGLTGIMPAEPPTEAAHIVHPTDGQRFSISPITVDGTCPENTLVEIYKNEIFAGSTSCSSDGQFALQIDLMIGANSLIAKVYDALNQAGPDSNIVNIFYDALPPQADPLSPIFLDGEQMILNTDAAFRGKFPGEVMSMPIKIIGGVPPYAISIQWGDSESTVLSRSDSLEFNATHTYAKAGTYQINIQASDSTGRVAFLSVAAIINGQPNVVSSTNIFSDSETNRLLVLWPLYLAAIAVVISFFLGEWREKRILIKHGLLSAS